MVERGQTACYNSCWNSSSCSLYSSPGSRGPGISFLYKLAGSVVSKGRPIYFPKLKPILNMMRVLYRGQGRIWHWYPRIRWKSQMGLENDTRWWTPGQFTGPMGVTVVLTLCYFHFRIIHFSSFLRNLYLLDMSGLGVSQFKEVHVKYLVHCNKLIHGQITTTWCCKLWF